MKVKDIMRKDFLSFQGDDKLEYIIKTFAEKKITSAPVFDDDEFIGIISDTYVVKYFTPKKFTFLWKKKEQTPMEELKKVVASKIAKKSRVILKPEQELVSVLGKIVKEIDCIPVVDKGQLVGIVRSEDMINFFLKEFASHNYTDELKEAKKEVGENVSTEVDNILKIVNEREFISAKDIAKELGMSLKTVEKLGECLHDHHLIEMKYSFFKGAEFRRKNHEKR